jgi:hypothetical protein
VVTSISRGACVDRKVSGVPQRGQKVRVPCTDERRSLGFPATTWNDAAGTVNQATNGAPLVRRQTLQWQHVSCVAAPPARYRT